MFPHIKLLRSFTELSAILINLFSHPFACFNELSLRSGPMNPNGILVIPFFFMSSLEIVLIEIEELGSVNLVSSGSVRTGGIDSFVPPCNANCCD